MGAAIASKLFALNRHWPQLINAVLMPAMFEDSTHQLWYCQTGDGPLVLKVCDPDRLSSSATWQVMRSLFDFSLADELANAAQVRTIINQHGLLGIPEVIDAAAPNADAPGYVLSRFARGESLSADALSMSMVSDFARHIARLHQQTSQGWGSLTMADMPPESWPEQLIKTFLRFSSQLKIGEPWLHKVISAIEQVKPSYFCPIMLDNRWDQYLYSAGNISTLVDIDAFVIGPPELELVLLEYQLSGAQAACFAQVYQQYMPMPELSDVRASYRLLLFLMNALGESNLDQWMRAAVKW